jgi:zinc protease
MTRTPPRAFGFLLAVVLPTLSWAAEKLPSDERYRTGTLANGVKWIFREHANPPQKMALLIHVATGSLNETDEQRGLAHFLEHMAFNGTENFKPGELIPYFESIGMEFGPDLNAFTSFDQTVYLLFLPDPKVSTVDDGLKVLSDYAFRQLLLEDELDKERGVIAAELRAGMSAEQRIQDKLFERMFEGMRIAKRLPIGIAEVIEKAPRSEFERYYRTWYRPERVTLMIVGDGKLEDYLPSIEKWFGQYKPSTPAEQDRRAELRPFTQERAIVLSDPDYERCDVDLYNILPGRPATTTVEQARVDLVEHVGNWILARRFSERVKKGEASYRRAATMVMNLFHEGMLVNASALGEPANWEKMLDELIAEVERARIHGLLPQELELAKKELLADAERAVRTEPTRDAQSLLMTMREKVNDGEPIMSAAQELEILKRLLPTITLEEVNAAFAVNFKPGTFAYVVTLPQKEGVKLPTEEEVLAAARAATARKPEPPQWEERPTTLLDKEPTPGKLVESTTDPDLQVTSGGLDNGVRVHHRYMDYRKDTVLVSIALAGGEIEETAENAGVTTVASLVFSQPATSRLRSTDVEDIMTGKNISVRGVTQGDSLTVLVTGSPVDLETGLQLAHALLTDGRIEQTAFTKWREQALQDYANNSRQPRFAAIEALLDLVSGGDPRRTLMNPRKIEAQSLDRAQEWFERLCRTAPIEVAVVGEIKWEEALPLIERYVGSLPKRAREATHLNALRKLPRKAGPLEQRTRVTTTTPQAMVITGFIGVQADDVVAVRAMNLAALTLDSRLVKRVREDLGLVYGIGANNVPAEIYDDSGLFLSGAPCAPASGEDVLREVEATYKAFAESGPTPEELENAKKQTANHLDKQLREPQFWFERLQHLDLHRMKLADLKNIPEGYAALTAEQVRDTFRKCYTAERTFRVVAVPANDQIEEEGPSADVKTRSPAKP